MDVSPVLDLLRKKIGLNPESIGVASVERAVRERIEMSGAASVEEFVKNVNLSVAELNALIESVLIRETSFFRNRTPFIALRSYLKQFVLNKRRGKPLRILCLPCSTGEEAYSIAMVLFDLKLSADKFVIRAGDISEHVLKIAEAGRYSAYSFRGGDIDFRKKYFTEEPDGSYQLNKDVREAVRFEKANILDDKFQLGHEPFDVIFCRNLLIYFDPAAKSKAINALARHLSDTGVLFVGHAEGANVSSAGFSSLDYPMSFAFARKEYATAINEFLNKNSPTIGSSSTKIQALQYTGRSGVAYLDDRKMTPHAYQSVNNAEKVKEKEKEIIKLPAAEDITADIALAQQLADAGSYREAEAICEKLLSEGVETAELYYLLGQVSGAAEDYLLAEECLRKAVYLNAEFYDALICLSNLFDRMGNPGKAAAFLARAQRVKLRENGSAKK